MAYRICVIRIVLIYTAFIDEGTMALMPFAGNTFLDILFENAVTPIAYMDMGFNFIHVNNAFALAVHKDNSFFSNKNYFSLLPCDENLKIFNQVVATGKPYNSKDNTTDYSNVIEIAGADWEWSLSRVNDEQGFEPGVLLQLFPVSNYSEIEQQLYQKVKKELQSYDEELEMVIESRTKLLQQVIEKLQAEKKESAKAEALMLKAKENAENANISKSQFLSRMSHELRTPLNAILGFSQLLNANDLDEKQKLYNDEIILAGNHLLAMLSDILDLSRIEQDQFPISISDASLNRITLESIALVEHKINYRNITIHNLMPEHDEICIRCDETRVKEVLVNLLTNAVKYNNDNGLISIGYKQINNDVIRVYVSDTGKGLSEKEKTLIFEPFNRLGAEYTDIEGVGIGLTIAKKLMEMMGGSIGIESKKGEGSTFYIDCPIGVNIREVKSKSVLTKLNINNEQRQEYNILYVEDNKSNQKVIKNLLFEYTNFKLTLTDTAESGFDKIKDTNFDLIIMDINLPGMDGYDALKNIKENAATKNIPVIALSATADAENIKKGLEAGFNQYVTKPVILPNLISVIHKELNRPARN